MASMHDSKFLDNPEFVSRLVSYLELEQQGRPSDPDQLRSDFPEYAADLAQFLDGQKDLNVLLSGLAKFSDEASLEATARSTGPTDDFRVGETIRYIGEYEILEEIARGGMGIVFKAMQQPLKRIVALKMILAGRLADVSEIERFRREAQVAGRVKHPHIVPIHEIGEYEGRHYFTMDFIEGCSLAEQLREESLEHKQAAELIRLTALAVQAAHRQGILHRDLKPANILIAADGSPRVTDFGLSKLFDAVSEESRAELTATGEVVGTPSYMSPEQATGNSEAISPRSDIYALGAVLYACLTGRAPFVSNSPIDTLMQVTHYEPAAPHVLNPNVPKDLETICLKCLSKEPEKRYATAGELAEDLSRFLAGRPVLARPVGQLERMWRWIQRNTIVALLLLLVFFSLAAGTAISTWFAIAERSQRIITNDAKNLAVQQQELAEQERDAAKRAKAVAERRRQDLRRQLYVAQIAQAQQSWEEGNVARMNKLIEAQIPEAGEEDLRGFEWHYLAGLESHSRIHQFQNDAPAYDSLCDPNGEWVATLTSNRVELRDITTGDLISEFAVDSGQDGRLANSQDGRFLSAGHRRVHLWDLSKRELVWQTEIGDLIADIEFDDNSKQLAVIRHIPGKKVTAAVNIHVVDSGEIQRTITFPTEIWSVDFDPSGQKMVGTCHDNKSRMWDLSTGLELRRWQTPPLATAITYSPDGSKIAFGEDGSIQGVYVLDAKTFRMLAKWKHLGSYTTRLAFHDNSVYLAVGGSSQMVYILNTRTNLIDYIFRGHESDLVGVCFRPGYQQVISTDRKGHTKVWHLHLTQGIAKLNRFEPFATDVAFSPNGEWLAAAQGAFWDRMTAGGLQLWNAKTGETGPRLRGHAGGVFGVEFLPDGRKLVSVGAEGTVVVWDLETNEAIKIIDAKSSLGSLALSRDGRLIMTGGEEGRVVVWDLRTEKPINEFDLQEGLVPSVAFSPDGRFVAACSEGGIAAWELDGGRPIFNDMSSDFECVTFNHAGTRLVFGGLGRVRMYNTNSWKQSAELLSDSSQVVGISFHHDDQRLATRSYDGIVKIWDVDTLQPMLTLRLDRALGTDPHDPIFSPDGQLLVAGRRGDGIFRLWSTRGTIITPPMIDPDSFARRGNAKALNQQWDAALADIEQVLTIEPDNGWRRVNATTLAAMAGNQQAYRKHAELAFEQAVQLSAEQPLLSGRLIRSACLLPGVHDEYVTAADIAEEIWLKKKSYDEGTGALYAYYRAGQYKKLLEACDELIKIRKGASLPRHFRALAFLKLDRTLEAVKALSEGTSRLDNMLPQMGKGRRLKTKYYDWVVATYLIAHEADEAVQEVLNQALEREPDRIEWLEHRGCLHQRWHRWDQAAADFKRLTELAPDNMKYWEMAAIMSLLVGDVTAYDELSRAYEEKVRVSEFAESAWSASRVCSLLPDAIEDHAKLAQQVRIITAKHRRHWWRRVAEVAVNYRGGNLTEAERLLPSAANASGNNLACPSVDKAVASPHSN